MSLEKSKVKAAIKKSQAFLLYGIENHLLTNKQKQQKFLINPCPSATALAILVSRKNSKSVKNAISWLRKIQNEDGGWGIANNVPSDINSTSLCLLAIEETGKQIEEKARMFIEENGGFSKTEWFVQMILSSFDKYPPDEIRTPSACSVELPPSELRFTPLFYSKLYPYAKDMFFSLTALEMLTKYRNADKILRFLESVQGLDGSWKQDIIITSLATLAAQKSKIKPRINPYRWLSEVQYSDGSWPAFNQMICWDIGLASSILASKFLQDERLQRAREYLENGMYLDGSFGMTLPHAVPDIDDTAVALIGLKSLRSEKTLQTVQYLKSMQNIDGSWSTFPEYYGSPPYCVSGKVVHLPSTDITCHVLKALYDEPATNKEPFIESALDWLVSAQNKDGSWETTWFNSNVYATSEAIITLHKFGIKGKNISKGLEWLSCQQRSNGSFGYGTVEETSLASTALMICSFDKVNIDSAIQFLLDEQNSDGSFSPSYSGVYFLLLYYNDPIYSACLGLNALELYDKKEG
jgi:squalene cyclase